MKLKCWNDFSTDSITKTAYITVSNTLMPLVNFSSDKQVLCFGDTVRFTDLTQYCPNAWSWQFAPDAVTYVNGTSSTDQNPQVVFNVFGPYNVTLTVTNTNGPGSLTKTEYILNGGYTTAFHENFAGGFSDHHWIIVNPENDMTWDTITVPGLASGSKAAWMNLYNYPYYNRRDQLISPPLLMPSTPPVELSFRHAYAQRLSIKDSLIIKISEDCGKTWTRIWAKGPDGTATNFVTAPPSTTSFVPQSSNDWCGGSYGVACYSIDLAAYAGKSNIKLMFESFNKNGNNLYLSDILVQGEVGISEQATDLGGISIYPNPSHGLFTLECKTCTGAQHLSILTTEGLEVYARNIPESKKALKETIDLRNLAKGIYFVRMTENNGMKAGKIVID